MAQGSIFSSPTIIEDIDAICVGTLDGVLALLKMVSMHKHLDFALIQHFFFCLVKIKIVISYDF